MDRCTRWFHTGVALALEVAVPLAAVAADGVEARVPGDRDRCPVCGMFVAPFPEWLAQIVYRDGSVLFFDGAKDLFRYLLDPERAARGPGGPGIDRIIVTGYYDRRAVDARRASFVAGSDVLGPMGAELVAHASAAEARDFARDHGGARVLSFGEVTRGVLDGLD